MRITEQREAEMAAEVFDPNNLGVPFVRRVFRQINNMDDFLIYRLLMQGSSTFNSPYKMSSENGIDGRNAIVTANLTKSNSSNDLEKKQTALENSNGRTNNETSSIVQPRKWSVGYPYGKSNPFPETKKLYGMPEKLFKVIVIGDPTVGKTAFVQRYVSNVFKREFKGTVGVDFSLKLLSYSEFETIKLQLWDIAGQERFTWMTRVYYKDAHGCIIMFDLTNRTSFLNTLKWKQDVDSKCSLPDGNPIPCILLGNKCDLSTRQIDQMEIETFARDHNFIGWTEVSAKEGLMVNDSMKFLVDTMLKQENVEIDGSASKSDTLKLENSSKEQNQKKSFCLC